MDGSLLIKNPIFILPVFLTMKKKQAIFCSKIIIILFIISKYIYVKVYKTSSKGLRGRFNFGIQEAVQIWSGFHFKCNIKVLLRDFKHI
jgi:hypothetical protein